MTVKYVNPDEPNVLENNEKVVFGKIIFNAHIEEKGDVSFLPLGLGLVQVETENRARWSPVIRRKTIAFEPPDMREYETYESQRHPWFEDDGTFFWILETGSYRIDALGWGYTRGLGSDPEPNKLRVHSYATLKPGGPPECGFLINPGATFTVSKDNGALYVGTLLVDMDIVKKDGIAVKKVRSVEIRDDFTEAVGLLKSLYPKFTLPIKKGLMSVEGPPVAVENGRCPSRTEVLFRGLLEGLGNAISNISIPNL